MFYVFVSYVIVPNWITFTWLLNEASLHLRLVVLTSAVDGWEKGNVFNSNKNSEMNLRDFPGMVLVRARQGC